MFQHRGTSLSKQYETCIGTYKIVHMENTAICLLQKPDSDHFATSWAHEWKLYHVETKLATPTFTV